MIVALALGMLVLLAWQIFMRFVVGQALSWSEELALTGKRWDVYDIARFFEEEFFETKKVVYTPKK